MREAIEKARRAQQAHEQKHDVQLEIPEPCISCGEGMVKGVCPKSKRECGHHCNHSWSHDECDWCGKIWA